RRARDDGELQTEHLCALPVSSECIFHSYGAASATPADLSPTPGKCDRAWERELRAMSPCSSGQPLSKYRMAGTSSCRDTAAAKRNLSPELRQSSGGRSSAATPLNQTTTENLY